MIKISKTNAFRLVSLLSAVNEEETANKIMQIIARSIKKDNANKGFSPYIEVYEKKEIKMLKQLSERYQNIISIKEEQGE